MKYFHPLASFCSFLAHIRTHPITLKLYQIIKSMTLVQYYEKNANLILAHLSNMVISNFKKQVQWTENYNLYIKL